MSLGISRYWYILIKSVYSSILKDINMPRITIDLPDTYLFRTEITVRIDDINYGGHLGHDRFFTLAHEARMRFLKDNDLCEENIYGSGIIMADAAAVYGAESFYGDRLLVRIGSGEISRSGFELIYLFSSFEDDSEVARVKTGMVFFDYAERKVVRIPEQFINILKSVS